MKQGEHANAPVRRAWLRAARAPDAAAEAAIVGESNAARVLDFEHIWLLQGVPMPDLEALAAVCTVRRSTPGETIFKQGDAPDGLYLLISGTVRIFAQVEDGYRLLGSVGAGECFGEMGVIDGEERSATAMTATLARLCFVPTEPILDLMERVPIVSMKLLALLSDRLRQSNRLASDISGTLRRVVDSDDPGA